MSPGISSQWLHHSSPFQNMLGASIGHVSLPASSLLALIVPPIVLQLVRAYFALIYSAHSHFGTSEPLFSL